MEEIKIQRLKNSAEIPWELLLLADPSKEMILKYLPKSVIYVATINNDVIGEYVLTEISGDEVELKNIAISPKHQRQGLGKKLILDAISTAKDMGVKRIVVGTGTPSYQQDLYEKCGFKIIGVEKDFFTKNYKEEIIENGVKLKDMVRLAIEFK